jgi:hypothetical protein
MLDSSRQAGVATLRKTDGNITEDDFVVCASHELMDHFNNRWSQGAPVTEGEAKDLALALWVSAKRNGRTLG